MSQQTDEIRSQIPQPLLERIDKIEATIKGSMAKEFNRKIAAFDLDNTLLEGDIGDALFVQLMQDGVKMPLTWAGYQDMLKNKGKKVAYTRVITAMAGISVHAVNETTKRVMANPATCLETDGERIVVPRPNKMMQALVNYLNQLEYEIYVISASNQYSVVYIAKTFFGIPESHVFGMKPTTHKNQQGTEVLGNEIEEPGTVGEGKALTYWKFIGHIPPLITAGDSTTDLPILKLTHHLGLCIWVGKDKKVYEHIKKECNHPQTTFFLFRDLGF